MRKNLPDHLEKARTQQAPYITPVGALYGKFEIRCPGSRYKLWILSSGETHDAGIYTGPGPGVGSWEHVSVSVPGKKFCPSWEEMCWVKDLFWGEEETGNPVSPTKKRIREHAQPCAAPVEAAL